jgi:sortase A
MRVRSRALVGRIQIPRIGLSAMIVEGDDARTLRRAVGHIPGTALPDEPGNVVLAGHRDTFFRPLQNARKNDEIVLTTADGIYRYRIGSIRVVGPNDTRVLRSSDEPILTLVTCYPFSYIGAAPQRFVVQAFRISRGGIHG